MNKKSIAYVAVLVILIIVFLIIKTNDRTERRIRFFDADSASIASIEISTITDTIILVKEIDNWIIDYPVHYPIEARKITDLFDKVMQVETSNLPVSESETSFETYNVTDSLGTTVTLLDAAGNELIKAVIGKSSNYNFSHGRFEGSKEVYQLYANISSILNPDVSGWREKEIVKLADDPAQIIVGAGERMLTYTATDSLWNFAEGDTSFFINEGNRFLTTVLNNSKSFRASSFIDNEFASYAEKFSDPEMVVQIKLYSGEDIFLKYVAEEIDSRKYIVQKNDETDVLYLVFENLFTCFIPEIAELKE
jgi:uncharacterized protein DUF4340